MAEVTLERLAEGIRRANANGDIETVKKLGVAYRQMQGQGQGAPTALTGSVTPQGSSGAVSQNVGFAEGQAPTAQSEYDRRLDAIRRDYYPTADDSKWAEIAQRDFKPYDSGQLLNAGLTFGFGDEASGASAGLAALLSGQDAGRAYDDFSTMERARADLGREQGGVSGGIAEVVGAILAGRPDAAAARVTGLLPTMYEGAKAGAASGFAYGFGSSDGDLQQRIHDGAGSALFGAGTGAAVPAVMEAGKRIISPFRGSPAKTQAATVLQREGVELTAGQSLGNKGLMYREAELGGSAAEDFIERQGEQFTNAVLRRVGINAPRATPDVVDAGFSAIGQQFDDLATRNRIIPGNDLYGDLSTAWRDYSGVVSQSNRAPIVENMIRDVIAEARTGQISGEFYKALRSRIERAARGTRDPELAGALRDVRGALDDAMERTIGQTNPADLGAWQDVRGLYRNMLVVEDAIGRAGEKAADGLISPAALKSAAMRKGKRAFVRGNSDFTELANAGVSTMTPLPNSGTAGRLNAKLPLPIGAATGAGIGGTVAGLPGAAAGAVIGAGVPWAAGRAMLSGPGRAYLRNQVAAAPAGRMDAVVAALLARGQQPLLARSN